MTFELGVQKLLRLERKTCTENLIEPLLLNLYNLFPLLAARLKSHCGCDTPRLFLPEPFLCGVVLR